MNYSEEAYDKMLKDLFVRFPSFQNVGSSAYKPGLDNMMFFDSLAGHPHRKYRTMHIAGTNGKGFIFRDRDAGRFAGKENAITRTSSGPASSEKVSRSRRSACSRCTSISLYINWERV